MTDFHWQQFSEKTKPLVEDALALVLFAVLAVVYMTLAYLFW